ncbi:TPA: hypothetical protein ACISXX_004930, partial [Salmonella enterica subsp. diarizonae serovar 61:l,v:z35]
MSTVKTSPVLKCSRVISLGETVYLILHSGYRCRGTSAEIKFLFIDWEDSFSTQLIIREYENAL